MDSTNLIVRARLLSKGCGRQSCEVIALECQMSSFVCDDCGDFSDEKNCTSFKIPALQNCSGTEWMCNGVRDCLDASDETFAFGCSAHDCDELSCSLHNCSHECIQTPTEQLCLCPKGYHQLADQRCTDINQCGICNQKCNNTNGYCDNKYTVED